MRHEYSYSSQSILLDIGVTPDISTDLPAFLVSQLSTSLPLLSSNILHTEYYMSGLLCLVRLLILISWACTRRLPSDQT